MILVVLFTLLLLAGLLTVGMRLSLSSKQNTGDQAAILASQYQSESAVAAARARIRDIQALLSAASISVPSGTTSVTMKSNAELFCGNTNWIAATDRANTTECKVTGVGGSNQFKVLSDFISSAAYSAILPASEASGAGSTSWWKSQLTQTVNVGSGAVTAKYVIQPTRVQQTGTTSSSFRFFFKVASLTAKGNNGRSTRVLTATADRNGEWWVDITMPAFLDNVLFTNIHKTRSGTIPGFDSQAFNGPIHTNEKFLFYSGSTASFKTKMTSAGCTNIASLPAGSITCTAQSGVLLGSASGLTSAGASSGTIKASIDSYSYNNVKWNEMLPGQPNFQAAYRPMPTTANTQSTDAQTDGLYLPSSVRGIELRAGSSTGSTPSTYDAVTKSWSPAPTHQFIIVTSSTGTKTYYRYGADNALYSSTSLAGPYNTLVRSNFNGVIFGGNAIGWKDSYGVKQGGLTGPGRTPAGQALPALASFAKMTVAAQSDIYISGDLTMTQNPLVCATGDSTCRTDANSRTNVLGLYTQAGDMSITKSAPNNINIHAMTMAAQGEVNVDGYSTGSDRGKVNLVGGLVENYYGAFGTTSPTGYGRNFSYDQRFLDIPGFGPPSFPVSPKWIGTDSKDEGKFLDNIVWQQNSAGAF